MAPLNSQTVKNNTNARRGSDRYGQLSTNADSSTSGTKGGGRSSSSGGGCCNTTRRCSGWLSVTLLSGIIAFVTVVITSISIGATIYLYAFDSAERAAKAATEMQMEKTEMRILSLVSTADYLSSSIQFSMRAQRRFPLPSDDPQALDAHHAVAGERGGTTLARRSNSDDINGWWLKWQSLTLPQAHFTELELIRLGFADGARVATYAEQRGVEENDLSALNASSARSKTIYTDFDEVSLRCPNAKNETDASLCLQNLENIEDVSGSSSEYSPPNKEGFGPRRNTSRASPFPSMVSVLLSENGCEVGRSYHNDSFDPRTDSFYNDSMVPFERQWKPISFPAFSAIPVIRHIFSLYNSSGSFLGVGEMQLRLNLLRRLASSSRATAGTQVFVLDGNSNVVATSLNREVYTTSKVSHNFSFTSSSSASFSEVSVQNQQQMLLLLQQQEGQQTAVSEGTVAEKADPLPTADLADLSRRCAISSSSTTAQSSSSSSSSSLPLRSLHCTTNVSTFGHEDLRLVYASAPRNTNGIRKYKLGGGREFFVMSRVVEFMGGGSGGGSSGSVASGTTGLSVSSASSSSTSAVDTSSSSLISSFFEFLFPSTSSANSGDGDDDVVSASAKEVASSAALGGATRPSDGLRWRVIVIVPSNEILSDLTDGLTTSLIIVVCILAASLIVVSVLVRVLLKPLGEVVEAMASGSYLSYLECDDEDGNGGGEDGGGGSGDDRSSSDDDDEINLLSAGAAGSPSSPNDPHKQRGKKKRKKNATKRKSKETDEGKLPNTKKKTPSRTLSYLSDVAAIQKAYWTMADELRALRGYIPEHVCEQLLAKAAAAANNNESSSASSSFGTEDEAKRSRELIVGGGLITIRSAAAVAAPSTQSAAAAASSTASPHQSSLQPPNSLPANKAGKGKYAPNNNTNSGGANNATAAAAAAAAAGSTNKNAIGGANRHPRRSEHINSSFDRMNVAGGPTPSVREEEDFDDHHGEYDDDDHHEFSHHSQNIDGMFDSFNDNNGAIEMQSPSSRRTPAAVGGRPTHGGAGANNNTNNTANNRRRQEVEIVGFDDSQAGGIFCGRKARIGITTTPGDGWCGAGAVCSNNGNDLVHVPLSAGRPSSGRGGGGGPRRGATPAGTNGGGGGGSHDSLNATGTTAVGGGFVAGGRHHAGGGGFDDDDTYLHNNTRMSRSGTPNTAAVLSQQNLQRVGIDVAVNMIQQTNNNGNGMPMANAPSAAHQQHQYDPAGHLAHIDGGVGMGGGAVTGSGIATATNSGIPAHDDDPCPPLVVEHNGVDGGEEGDAAAAVRRRQQQQNQLDLWSGSGNGNEHNRNANTNNHHHNYVTADDFPDAITVAFTTESQFALRSDPTAAQQRDDDIMRRRQFNAHNFNNANLTNSLGGRYVSVATVNIVGFHAYAATTPAARIAKDHEAVVSFIHECAKRSGGVLDTFSGDKFWVSFNATNRCEEHAVAATLFACDVVGAINKEAAQYHQQQQAEEMAGRGGGGPEPRFTAALSGATAGVATGKAFVGPLGTNRIRRHTIISSAVPQAAALERLASRYPDCGVMVGGDMIPAIEGYFQYLLVDAIALPGSGGKRRRVASVKGPMSSPPPAKPFPPHLMANALASFGVASTVAPTTGPSASAAVGSGAAPTEGHQSTSTSPPAATTSIALPLHSPYATINACFNAFLEGRVDDVGLLLGKLSIHIEASMLFHQYGGGVSDLIPLEAYNNSGLAIAVPLATAAPHSEGSPVLADAAVTAGGHRSPPISVVDDGPSASPSLPSGALAAPQLSQSYPHQHQQQPNTPAAAATVPVLVQLPPPPAEGWLQPHECGTISMAAQGIAALSQQSDGRLYKNPVGAIF